MPPTQNSGQSSDRPVNSCSSKHSGRIDQLRPPPQAQENLKRQQHRLLSPIRTAKKTCPPVRNQPTSGDAIVPSTSTADVAVQDRPSLPITTPPSSSSSGSKQIQYRLNKKNPFVAGLILAYCTDLILSIIERCHELLVYKIGITTDPETRWFSPSMGYRKDNMFDNMTVFHKGSADQSGMMEAALIQYFRLVHAQGLQNIKPGGEGIGRARADNAEQDTYVYVVHRALPARPPIVQ